MSTKITTGNAQTIVAIDQHAKSSTLCALDKQTGETKKRYFSNCPEYSEFVLWLDTWATPPYYFAYESGPCGFSLARNLRDAGLACDIIAVSSIPRSPKEKVMKDDLCDAKCLLAAITSQSNTLSAVYVPSVFAEDARDAVRQYYYESADLRRAKQHTNAHLLRHGFTYNEKTSTGRPKRLWTLDHERWLNKVELSTETQGDILITSRNKIQELELHVLDARNKIEELAASPQFEKYVKCFCAIKGIGILAAVAFCAEIEDFDRFACGRSLASYLGLIPKRHNSGDKKRNGSINKCGDRTLRRALIEGFSAVSRFNSCAVCAHALKDIPKEVRIHIENANKRIMKRYKTLKANGKNHNVIKVALAREAACHMLYIGQAINHLEENAHA